MERRVGSSFSPRDEEADTQAHKAHTQRDDAVLCECCVPHSLLSLAGKPDSTPASISPAFQPDIQFSNCVSQADR